MAKQQDSQDQQQDNAQPEVTLKPSAIEVEQPKKVADLPVYHTEETAKIAEDRAKEVGSKKDEMYSYEANGYKVQQRKADEQEKGFADENGYVYDVDGNDLPKRVYGNKREAEIFAESHSPNFAKQSATMPSV